MSLERLLIAPPEVPAEFWQDDRVRAALESRHMGQVIRAYRHHPSHGRRGLAQDDIAAWAGITQGQVCKIERSRAGNRLDRLIFWARLLRIPEDLLWFKLPRDVRGGVPAPVALPTGPGAAVALAALIEMQGSLADTAVGEDVRLATAPGRFFPGVTIQAKAYPAASNDRVLLTASGTSLPSNAGRGLVVGVDERAGLAYGMDLRRAGRRLAKLPDGAGLLVPGAYRFDDLTLGLVWAVANLDEALLSDDAVLAAHRSRLAGYDDLQASSVQREVADDLSSIGQMWLGSDFCARHILRNAEVFSDTPVFWTQERRGEDASAWLLFGHKVDYLRALADLYEGRRLVRAFCVPEAEVAGSSPSERVLFLLAASLMESFDIEVALCPEPEYTAVDGFVLDEKRQAIVASWVGVDSLWKVDVTRSRSTVQEFVDACGFARAHSVTAGAEPSSRLQALGEYLHLDWGWFVARCTELADYGSAGLFEPRSRLLSAAGVDQACQFVAGLDR